MHAPFRPALAWSTIRRVVVTALVGLVAFLVLGNAVIAAAWQLESRGEEAPFEVAGVRNFRVVDGRLWRGDAPSEASYRQLADRGVTTVVDLRAEHGIVHDLALLRSLGLRLVRIPMRDGQAPTDAQVKRFLHAVRTSDGGPTSRLSSMASVPLRRPAATW